MTPKQLAELLEPHVQGDHGCYKCLLTWARIKELPRLDDDHVIEIRKDRQYEWLFHVSLSKRTL